MNNLRQAAQQALEALDCPGKAKTDDEQAAITALRAALAEHGRLAGIEMLEKLSNIHVSQQAEPQTTHWEGCEAVHPECRKQEPDGISWLKRDSGYFTAPTPQHDTDCHLQGICQRSGYSIANTPRRPLTDEEIVTIWRQHNEQYNPHLIDGLLFARAIERAHGIGEQHGS